MNQEKLSPVFFSTLPPLVIKKLAKKKNTLGTHDQNDLSDI